MKSFSKLAVALGIVVAVVATGFLIGWFAGGSGSKVNPPPANPYAPDAYHNSAAPVNDSSSRRNDTANAENLSAPAAPVTPRVVAQDIITNWEEKVDEILGGETDDTNKVKQLFELFPRVPAEAKAEVAQHLSNLTSDTDYSALGELLKDGTLPDATLDVLMSDALNRPNSIKLPELLAVAETPDHPKASEAKDILALFLDEDYGTDWAQWQDKIAAWLKDNPD